MCGQKVRKDESELNGWYLLDVFLDMMLPMIFLALMLFVQFELEPVQIQSYSGSSSAEDIAWYGQIRYQTVFLLMDYNFFACYFGGMVLYLFGRQCATAFSHSEWCCCKRYR